MNFLVDVTSFLISISIFYTGCAVLVGTETEKVIDLSVETRTCTPCKKNCHTMFAILIILRQVEEWRQPVRWKCLVDQNKMGSDIQPSLVTVTVQLRQL